MMEYTVPVSNLISLRLYSDSRPRNFSIAGLQKGLILIHRGVELAGEGTGFGVPAVRLRDKTFFSGSATLRVLGRGDSAIAVKQFALNMILERSLEGVKMESKVLHKLVRLQEEMYQKRRRWRSLIMRYWHLLKFFGVHASFVQVKPVGEASITYHVEPPHIHVEADFQLREENDLQKIFIFNEQGSSYFNRYRDSDNTVLSNGQIGEWEKVEADWAYLYNEEGDVGFRLWKMEDSVLHRGREFLAGVLDWAGLDYEAGSGKTAFKYKIEILGGSEKR